MRQETRDCCDLGSPVSCLASGYLVALLVPSNLNRLVLANVHADLAWLDLLGLGDLQPQHAVGQRGLNLIGLDGGRQADCALERAEAALNSMEVALLVLSFLANLTLDRQHIVLNRDLYILGLDARQRRLDQVALGGLA